MSQSNSGSQKLFLYLIAGFTVLVVIFIVFFSINEQKNSVSGQVKNYTQSESDRPKAVAAETFSDLGVIKVNEEKSADFTIENTGNKSLQLFNITSSCGCTVGIISIGGKTSPEFGMHSKSNWTGEIPQGEKATVSVVYRPYIMPVKGEVTRDVYISTNDPDNKLLTFTVKANVE